MPTQHPLTPQAVRDWSGDREIDKGRPYAAGGAVRRPSRQGNTLKADVRGTRAKPYRVWVRLAGGGVIAADCSCPVGAGGGCKHVAAVLLAYLGDPNQFPEVPDLDTALQARDKAELIALVKRMVRRAPRLERMVVGPPPGRSRQAPTVGGGGDAGDLATYRRLAEEHIGRRTREHYRQACVYLAHAGRVAARLGQLAEFRGYLSALAERHRGLGALQEELRAAELLVEVPPTAVRRTR